MLTALLLALAADFRAIELHDGGEVIVRYAPVRQVRFIAGDARLSRISEINGRLVIEHCPDRCPRDYRMVVEVATPEIAALSVNDGGSIRGEGGFPAQAAIALHVSSGGVIDIRALEVADVTAAIAQGGLIFTRAERRLAASVAQGGAITYWGRPAVTRSVRHGGVVQRGADGDRDKPLPALNPGPAPIPPVPPLPSRF
jgi:hypothetical protein